MFMSKSKNKKMIEIQPDSNHETQIAPTAEQMELSARDPLEGPTQRLQAMEDSALGWTSGLDDKFKAHRDLTDMSHMLRRDSEGMVSMHNWSVGSRTVETEEDFAKLARYTKTAANMYEDKKAFVQHVSDFIGGTFSSQLEEAEPYDINFVALNWGKDIPLPGSDNYAERFHDAGQEHLTPPATVLSSENMVGLSEKGKLKAVANSYFQQMDELRLNQVTDRLHQLRDNDLETRDHEESLPDISVCIPVALLGEPEETILATLEALAKHTDGVKPEIIMFANYKVGDEVDEDQVAEKTAMLSRLQSQIEQSDSSASVRFVVEGYNPDEISIAQIRKDMTDMTALDLQDRGADYGHPIIWVDADTTNISNGMLKSHVEKHKANPHGVQLVSSNVRFTMSEKGDSESSTGQKIAAYAELQRRNNLKQGVESGYLEESGLSFSVGSHLFTGGVNNADPINESVWLKINSAVYAFNASRVFSEGIQYEHSKLENARLYTSGRRQVAGVERSLNSGTAPDNEYLYFTHDAELFTGDDNQTRQGGVKSTDETHQPELVEANISAIDRNTDTLVSAQTANLETDVSNISKRNTRARALIGLVQKHSN